MTDFLTRVKSGDLKPAEWGALTALLVFLVDRISKWWILSVVNLDERLQVPVLPFFDLSMVWNKGVSFGLFQADSLFGRLVLFTFAIAVSAVLAKWMWEARRPWQAVFFGLIIGGAVGNAIDRLVFGAVVDFLDFSGIPFPFGYSFKWVFNGADSGITVGVALLVLDAIFAKEDRPQGEAPN